MHSNWLLSKFAYNQLV